MLTDWVLTRRLAAELDERLRGARVDDAGLLVDGRVALSLHRRGKRSLLAFDLFASPPLVTLEDEQLGVSDEPGFVRSLVRSLRTMTLAGVTARRYDRLLRLRFCARSRFGIGDELELYAELVPRFGNLVLVKGGRVVAALKEFAPAENARRSVRTGDAYALPPLPVAARTLAPPSEAQSAAAIEPLHVYRRADALVQAYVTPLKGYEDAETSREPSLLAVFAELREGQRAAKGQARTEQRRQAMLKELNAREAKLRTELGRLAEQRGQADERDELRAAGEATFSTLHTLGPEEREAAKDRAAALFARYKRLGKSLPHLDARRRTVEEALDAVEMLRWETERTDDEGLPSVDSAIANLVRRPGERAAPARKRERKRAMLEFRTTHGSRIVVGRSPSENADVTFRVARPNDLWFHARGVPGAHVILAREDQTPPPDDDLRAAAAVAAFHSRAKAATSVDVDYTLRKHVRKQRAAPPGLVWYTQARTLAVVPKEIDALHATSPTITRIRGGCT